MTTFVLVPGGWYGGWYFRDFAKKLRDLGHSAYAVTLTGLGERSHLLTANVNLQTHVQDVVSVLEFEGIEDAVLLGHSYGGMVITGVAARIPQRIGSLIYGDAYVPQHGDSCWDLANDSVRRLFDELTSPDGLSVAPPGGRILVLRRTRAPR
jgi:pimeloyl-ACP methyl ester carboxylesterase